MEWLKYDFGGGFANKGDTLPHGMQTFSDVSSCGMYAINALAHELFGDKLVASKTMREERMQRFSDLAKAHNDYVSTGREIIKHVKSKTKAHHTLIGTTSDPCCNRH